ncbi:hypothetical protein [Streptomyces youssoufiensis]
MTAICGLCEHDLDTEAYLCAGCTRATAARLDRMPKLYAALAPYLAPAGRRPEHGRSGGGQPGAGLPVAEPALILRGPGGMVGVLEDWRAAMQADRGWGPPAVGGTTEDRVRAAARGLLLNLDWIAGQWPPAGAFAEEIRAVERSVLSVIDPPDPTTRARRLGYCPSAGADGAACGAVVLLEPGSTVARCRWCGCAWPPDRWSALADAQAGVASSEEVAASG